MRKFKPIVIIPWLPVLITILIFSSQQIRANHAIQATDNETNRETDGKMANKEVLSLFNNQIKYSLYIENKILISDKLEARHEWLEKFGTDSVSLETNADFAIDLFWTGWRVPGKENNADNFISLKKNDFRVEKVESKEFTDGIKELYIFLTDINTNLH